MNVNAYQLMCHVMQMKALPHNGTWSNVCDSLKDSKACVGGPFSAAMTSWRHDAVAFSFVIPAAFIAIFENLSAWQ